ncbi:MAG TPA: hypothetical protein VIF57_28795 [Polyangia bacterium]
MRAGTLVSGLGIATTLGALGVLCAAVISYPCFRATQARSSRDKVKALHEDLASYVRTHRACPDHPAHAFKDAWGTALTYACSDVELRARSAGPDKQFNTADDLTYPVSAARSGLR